MTSIRPASEKDLAGLLAIEDEFRRTGTHAWALMDEAFFQRKMAQDELLVGDDGGIVAWMSWTTIWRLPWIEFVRVLAARRREGIGRELVAALEERLRSAGGWLLLSSSSGGDDDAIAWHRAIGFADGGRISWDLFPGAPPEVLHSKRL